ncbi:MAG: hypothetical protein F6J95_024010 [Leptolyngbya sp. SIO1E4]|nr:hypothetical protein [Leptolyngbya sp. SIO1E4]
MANPYIPSDITTSPIMGEPTRIDQIANRLKERVRNNIITFLKKEFSISALDLFSSGQKGLQARPPFSLETAELLLKIAVSLIDFNGRRLCSKADAQRFTPLASTYPKELQYLWILLQQNGLGVALLNVGTVMFIKACQPDILPRERVPRHAVVTQPGGKQAIREGDYDHPLIHYFVPYPIPEWHDFDHIVATVIDDRFGNDLATIQKIPNKYTQLNSADPNYLVYLAPDDMTQFPIDSDYGVFQRIAPWFYRRALLQGMNVEETTNYVCDRLVGFLCRREPAGDFRTGRKLFLPHFSEDYNAQKRAALVWGSWGEVPSKEVSPYITFLDKEEPGITPGLIYSDEKTAHNAVRILFAIAEHEESPPTARRLLTELAYARASMAAAKISLSEANGLDSELQKILMALVDAYNFEAPNNHQEQHPVIPLRQWANWHQNTELCPSL